MRNKKSIRSLAIILALVSFYQLFFTYKTNQVENAAKEYAAGDPAKEKEYLDSIQNEVVYNLGIASFTYKECKELEMNLGLDLKGGMNVTMEVDVVDVLKSLANHSTDPTFNAALEEAVRLRVSDPTDFVTLFGRAFERIDPNAQLASPAIFGTRELESKIPRGAKNSDVLDVIRKEADGAIDNTFNILRTRIDAFGVVQPNVRKSDISGRIVIELPGVKDPQRVRELLQGTAALEFYETYDQEDYHPFLEAADNKLREILLAQEVASQPADAQPTDSARVTTTDSELMAAVSQQDSLSEGGELAADPYEPAVRRAPTESACRGRARGIVRRGLLPGKGYRQGEPIPGHAASQKSAAEKLAPAVEHEAHEGVCDALRNQDHQERRESAAGRGCDHGCENLLRPTVR